MRQVQELDDPLDTAMTSREADAQCLVPALDVHCQISTNAFKGVARATKPKRLSTTQRRAKSVGSRGMDNRVRDAGTSHIRQNATGHGPDTFSGWDPWPGCAKVALAQGRSQLPKGCLKTPRSVTIPESSSLGVTSNDGLKACAPSAATRWPANDRTSFSSRCSMGISAPEEIEKSKELNGAAV